MPSRIASPLSSTDNQFRAERVKPFKKRRKRFRRTPIRRAGKKVLEWESIRRALKPRFLAVGITTCELKLEGCRRGNGLSFCHAKKRRNCSPSDLWTAALGCLSCHQILELLPEQEMERRVHEIIDSRLVQP